MKSLDAATPATAGAFASGKPGFICGLSLCGTKGFRSATIVWD